MSNSPYVRTVGCRECGDSCDEISSSHDTHRLRELCQDCAMCEVCEERDYSGATLHWVEYDQPFPTRIARWRERICDACLADPEACGDLAGLLNLRIDGEKPAAVTS